MDDEIETARISQCGPTDGDWLGGRQAGRQAGWRQRHSRVEIERREVRGRDPYTRWCRRPCDRVKSQGLEELLSMN